MQNFLLRNYWDAIDGSYETKTHKYFDNYVLNILYNILYECFSSMHTEATIRCHFYIFTKYRLIHARVYLSYNFVK